MAMAMAKFTIEQHVNSGCTLVNPILWFVTLHAAGRGELCTTGCFDFNGGKCPAYKKMSADQGSARKDSSAKPPVETVRQEAARLGVTIAEVRRRRSQLKGVCNENHKE